MAKTDSKKNWWRTSILGVLIWSPLARADWSSLAKTSHDWFVRTCEDLPGLRTAAADPSCKTGATQKFAAQAVEITQQTYLAGLAREHAEGQACQANSLEASSSTFAEGGPAFVDVQRQLQQLRSIQSNLEAARASQDEGAKALIGEAEPGRDLNKEVAALETLKAAQIAAFPFSNHPAIQKYLRDAAEKPNGVEAHDHDGWSKAIRDAAGETQKNKLRWQQRADGHRPFEDQAKTQLAQDPELIESYFKRYPERAKDSKSAACAVDREWGRGAAARDSALKWSALAVGALIVPQARLVARPVAGAVLEAATATRIAAVARNVAGAQATSRVLATAAIATDIAVVSRAIDKECGASHVSTVARAGGATCESADVRSLGARKCAEIAVLSALGVSLGSPLALSLVQSFSKAARVAGQPGLARVERAFEDGRLAGVEPNGARVYESKSGLTMKIDPTRTRPRALDAPPEMPPSAKVIPFVKPVETRTPAAQELFGERSELVSIGKVGAPDIKYVSAPSGLQGKSQGMYNIEVRDPTTGAASLARMVKDKAPANYSEDQITKMIKFSLAKAKELNGRLSIRFDRAPGDVPSLRLSVDGAPEGLGNSRLVRVVESFETKTENQRFDLDLKSDMVSYLSNRGHTRSENGVVYTGGNAGTNFGVNILPEGVEINGKVERVMALPGREPLVNTAQEIAALLGRDTNVIKYNMQTEKYDTYVRSGADWVKKDLKLTN